MIEKAAVCASILLTAGSVLGAEQVVSVKDDASLRRALREAKPGTTIRIAPGQYQPGIYVAQLKGTRQHPIVIEGADDERPPRFEGGKVAWHLTDCAHLALRNITVRGQSGNGINIDDGGTYDSPSHDILLENLRVSEIGPKGNLDGIKLSGVDDFVIRRCRVEGWGGQAIDMVGCHRGLIEECEFVGKEGFSQAHGPQIKGGSSQITIRRSWFHNAGSRAVNLGGSTGRAYFRPPGALKDDREVLIEKMMASDGVVFASPNYSFHLSAIMKVFLDRLGFVFHRPRFFGKTFTSIVTQGIYGGDKIVSHLDFVGNGLGFNTVKGSCLTALEPMTEKEEQKRARVLARQSRRFYEELMKPGYPVPTLFKLMAFRMGRTSMRLELNDTSYDYRYYREKGWFESDYF